MKKTRLFMLTVMLATVTMVTSSAFGDLTSPKRINEFGLVGDAYDGGSWFQGFYFSSSSAFSNLGLVITRLRGDDGSSSFAPPAWDFDTIDGNPNNFAQSLAAGSPAWMTMAAGDSTNELFWTTHFGGERENQNFVVTLFAFDNDHSLGSISTGAAHWNGSAWNFRTPYGVTWEEFQALGGVTGVVPVPSAVLLGLMGLGLIGGRHLRRVQAA